MWGNKEEPPKPKSKVEIKTSKGYKPIFDFDLELIPFLVSVEKEAVGGYTKLMFKTSTGIPVLGILKEDLKPNGTWGYSLFAIQLVGRSDSDYNLIFEVGDNVIELYFDIKRIETAFQKLNFQIDQKHCNTYSKLREMVEQSNNLVYLDAVQRMRDRGETV